MTRKGFLGSEEAALRARVRELRLARLPVAQEQVTRKVALSKEGAQIRAENGLRA